MNKLKFLLGGVCIFATLIFTSCDNSADNNTGIDKTEHTDDAVHDSLNGGNYSPDQRNDNRVDDTSSTVGTTGSKFDAEGNSVTGNDDINSNRQQDATTGGAGNTEKRKQGE